MSQAPTVTDNIELRRRKYAEAKRKRTQGVMSGLVAGAAGTSLGLVATGKLKKMPRLTEAGYVTGTLGGGIGAISGGNFARNQFREAGEAKRDAREAKMNNKPLIRKSLSEIAKAQERKSAAVPPGTRAWMLANPYDVPARWRGHVSEGAARAYDYPLAPSRDKRNRRYAAGTGITVGSAGLAIHGGRRVSGALHGARLPKGGLAALGAGLAGMAGGEAVRRSGDKYDLASRKIRARGYQRMLDKRNEEYIEKGWRLPSLARTPGTGRLVLRNPSFAKPRLRRVM